jgi:ankyrin repeat protein
MLTMLSLAEFDFNLTGLDKRTALMVAATAGQFEAVEYMLELAKTLDIHVEARDAFHHTALDNAKSKGHDKIVDLLSRHSFTIK